MTVRLSSIIFPKTETHCSFLFIFEINKCILVFGNRYRLVEITPASFLASADAKNASDALQSLGIIKGTRLEF